MDAQRTLRRPISCAGIGLHSGNKVTLSLKPAPADFGIRFRRTDLGGLEMPATVHAPRRDSARDRRWRANEVSVETVEHLLAALVSMGIDNVIVELNSPEVPIMDGSAAPFIYLIQEAGVKRAAGAAQVPEDRPADRAVARRQAHRALSVGSLQGHLQHQLRSPAAAAPVAHAADHRGDRSSRRSRRRARSRS